MTVIPWNSAWRLTYETLDSINGVGYFSKEGLWILCGSPDIILTAKDEDLRKTPPLWTPRIDGGGSVHNAVATDASIAVVVGNSNWINESLDGITWSGSQTSPAGGQNLSAVSSGVDNTFLPFDIFVAVSSTSGGAIYSRAPAGGWSLQNTGAATNRLFGVCYAPDLVGSNEWLVVGDDSGSALVGVTNDPTIWTRYTTTQSPIFYCCARGNGLFMVGGPTGKVFTSPSGSSGTWTDRSIPGSFNSVRAVTYLGGSSWLAVGNTSVFHITSDDGVSWSTLSAVAPGTILAAESVVANETTLLAGGGRAWSSFEEEQEDTTLPSSPEPETPLEENTDYQGQAIGRLAQQFRS